MNEYLLNTYYVSDIVLFKMCKNTLFIILTIHIPSFYKANPVFPVFTIKAINFIYVYINRIVV